jgi:hypothetical protein
VLAVAPAKLSVCSDGVPTPGLRSGSSGAGKWKEGEAVRLRWREMTKSRSDKALPAVLEEARTDLSSSKKEPSSSSS